MPSFLKRGDGVFEIVGIHASTHVLRENALNAATFEDYPTAFQLYREILKIEPLSVGVHLEFGDLCVTIGNSVLAEEHYRIALEIDARCYLAYFKLGVCFGDILGREEVAIGHYESCLALKPDFPIARFNLAGLYAATGKCQEAARQYRRFSECLLISGDPTQLVSLETARNEIKRLARWDLFLVPAPIRVVRRRFFLAIATGVRVFSLGLRRTFVRQTSSS